MLKKSHNEFSWYKNEHSENDDDSHGDDKLATFLLIWLKRFNENFFSMAFPFFSN